MRSPSYKGLNFFKPLYEKVNTNLQTSFTLMRSICFKHNHVSAYDLEKCLGSALVLQLIFLFVSSLFKSSTQDPPADDFHRLPGFRDKSLTPE